MITKQKLNQMIVNDYPIRFYAYENHKTIVEHINTQTGDIKTYSELFYYYNIHPYKGENPYNLYGYCAVSIRSMSDMTFMLEVESEYPDIMRKQNNKHYFFNTYQEARQEALKQIEYIENWLQSDWWLELPITVSNSETWEDHRMKMIAPDGTKIVRLVGNHNKIKFNVDYKIKENDQNEYYRVQIKGD